MNIEELAQDIRSRLDSLGQLTSEDRIRTIIRETLAGLTSDDPIVRGLSFGKTTAPQLIGSKFSRFGFQVEDVEFAYDLMNAAVESRLSKNGPSEELTKAFEAVSSAFYLPEEEVRQIDRRAMDNLYPRVPKQYKRSFEAQIRAMDSQESGYGSQLIGASYIRELWEAARLESKVFNTIDSFEMMDPTVYLPVEVDFPELLYVPEVTANNPNNSDEYATVKTGTQRVQIDAKKFVLHQMWSGELEEDSILPLVPFLRRQVTLALAHYNDSLVVNGDNTNAATGNINLDDADPADTKHYLAFDGIRHVGLVDNTANQIDVAGIIDITHLKRMRSQMIDYTRFVDWGHPSDLNDLIFVGDPETIDNLAMLDEFKSMRIEAGIPVLNGEVGRLLGHPVIVSMAVRKTEADGKLSTTANNNTKGQLIAYNRRGFKFGWRRRLKVESERLAGRDQSRFIYSMRGGFGRFTPTGAASGIESASVAFNITLP